METLFLPCSTSTLLCSIKKEIRIKEKGGTGLFLVDKTTVHYLTLFEKYLLSRITRQIMQKHSRSRFAECLGCSGEHAPPL